MGRRVNNARVTVAALLLVAAALPAARAGCGYSLALPPGGGVDAAAAAASANGFCSPYASDGTVGGAPASLCSLSVPAASVLQFGTCALPGAVCSGATNLTLVDDSGSVLGAFGRVALNSSVAALSQGCVLGVRCSYGEWRNPALIASAVTVVESCHGKSACAGVVAWRVGADAAVLPALVPSTAAALAFTITAASAVTITQLAATLAASGSPVQIWTRAGDAFADNRLAAQLGTNPWTQAYNSAWSTATSTVSLNPILSIAAGATATVLVSAPTSTTLTCAHTLGDVSSTLLSDATLTVRQGGALAATSGGFPFTWSNGATCACAGLALTYATVANCPPAPPANVNVYNSGAHTMVDTLDDLLRALANPAVTDITVARHITLNGTALTISGTRTLQISGSNDCWPDLNTPAPCSLAGDGTSRLLSVSNGVTLTISSMLLRDGVAPAGQSGGCMLINCTTCKVSLAASVLSNCSAPSGPGGGIAVLGGGSLWMTNSTFSACDATGGGGLLVQDSTATLSLVVFDSNAATGSIADTTVALGGLPGPAGAGAALVNSNATVSDCRFLSNIAATSDVALLNNPSADQARGGGLFAAQSNVSVLRTTFADNAAFYGGGVYAHASTLSLATCALVANFATLGDGGGGFALNSAVTVTDSLLSANSAGGHAGGGIAAMNSTVTLERSTLIGNTAPAGCGGALGMDVGATLTVQCNSVVTGNSASSGGGVCCNRCTAMTVDDTLVYANAATHGSGGGAYISISPSTFVNATMWNNVAPAGGAVAAVSTWLNMTNCDLHDNSATLSHGGAVYHNSEDDLLDSLYMLNCAVANNTCMAGGGGVASFASASAAFDSCDFFNNTITSAAPAGGAIMLLNVPTATVTDCTFYYNELVLVPALEDGAPLGFVPGYDALMTAKGGALWIGSDVPTLTTVLRGDFTHNRAPDSGAIHLAGAAHFVLQGTVFYHDHTWSEDDVDLHEYSGVGGGFGMTDDVVAHISDAYFFSLESVRGGVGWHGGRAQATYTRCTFDDNEAKQGDDTKGTAIYLRDAAQVVLSGCLILNNEGHGIAEGTVTLGGTNMSRLHIEHSIFDGNWARLGSCLFITVPSQLQQLSLSNVTFRNSAAYVGAVMYTEAAEFGQLSCALPCYYDFALYNNSARNYGSEIATPPKTINLELPAAIRSGAPLAVNVTLLDGFGHTVKDWPNTVGTVESAGRLGGSLRTFYQSGAADFAGLSLSGLQNTSYEVSFTMSGQDLFGNDINTKSNATNVTVLSCLAGERFDTPNLVCRCATGYGLVLEDNTCRLCTADEVVPPGSLSCEACPALSKPAPGSTEQCVCRAGFYGTIVGAVGACTECPADTYRSVNDPPNKCLDCPVTSHTFALGATSVTDCLCAENTFNDRSGVNQTFSCAAVPDGGWAPQADSRLFALEGYWRPSANYSQFFSCTNGMCRKEFPAENGTQQLGYNCREGHTGHLCAVCEQDWAYQGVYCSKCDNTQKYEAWTPAKRGGLIFIGVFLLVTGLFFLFYLPLFPRIEAWTSSMLRPAMDRMEKVLTNVANAARPASGVGSRPVSSSAAYRPRSAGHRGIASTLASVTKSLRQRAVTEAPPPPPPQPRDGRAARDSTDSARRTSAFRRSSLRMGIAPSDSGAKGHDSASVVHVRVQRPNRVNLFLDMVAEPARIVIGFWQIVSSFSSNLYVPWPSIYYALANSLNVVSLQFLKLPAISCVQPAVSFFTIFNGVTIATAIYCIFCLTTYYMGARTTIATRDVERRQRFKSRVITVFIWGLFLVRCIVCTWSVAHKLSASAPRHAGLSAGCIHDAADLRLHRAGGQNVLADGRLSHQVLDAAAQRVRGRGRALVHSLSAGHSGCVHLCALQGACP